MELRPFRDADWPKVAEILTSEAVGKSYMLPQFASVEDARPLFDRLKALSADESRFVRGIYDDGILVGFLNDVEMTEASVELGYAVHPDCWGRGYATAGLRLAIAELFARGFREVVCGAFEENAASLRVMEKCGMQPLDRTDTVDYRGAVHCCVYRAVKR